MVTAAAHRFAQDRAALWVARIAAVLAFGFFMMFAIGEGFPPLLRQPASVQMHFAALGLIFAGYLVGWRSPATGGVVVLVGFVLMHVVNYVASGRLAGPWFLVFAVPGVLYLLAAWLGGRRAAKRRLRL